MKAKMKLVVDAGPQDEQEYPLDAEVIRLGRERARTIPIHDTQVSRRHAEITLDEAAAAKGEKWSISDLESTNGTFVNEEKVVGSRLLRKGDRVRVGRTTFSFEEVESGRAFHNLVAILIAVSTLVGAFVAWRVSEAMDTAEDIDVEGIAALVDDTQVKGDIATTLSLRQTAFADYHWQMVLAELLEGQVGLAGPDSPLTYRRMASVNYGLVDPDYVVPGSSLAAESFDAQRYYDALYASYTRRLNLDPTANFAAADRERTIARNLTLVGILLAASVFCYTGAEVSRSALKYGLAAGGVLLFLLATAGALLIFI
jgi:hypothetical protein